MIVGQNFVDGHWLDGPETVARENPSRPDETVGAYPASGKESALEAFAAAARAARRWQHTSVIERARILQRAAHNLGQRQAVIAGDICSEVGRPIVEARAEVERSIDLLGYYASFAWQPQGHVLASARDHTELRSRRVPLGVVALVTPWNLPLAIPVWKVAPALMMGNTAVLKPAPSGPCGAWHLVRALEEAGLPRGVLNLVIGEGIPFAEALLEFEELRAVSFTGSTGVGMTIKSNLADHMARVQLELGAKNSHVVWRDADVDHAAKLAAEAAYYSAGQKCTATSRVLIHINVFDEFQERFLAAVRALPLGNPAQESTRVGPLVTRESRDRMSSWTLRTQDDGGELLAGGRPSDRDGYFFEPTVFTRVPLQAPIAQAEVFGPIVTLHPVTELDEAIDAVNGTRYGLSTAISTRDLAVASRFASEVEVGVVHINHPTAGIEHQAPFGGAKLSAFGGKEQAWTALDFFSDWKTEVIRSQWNDPA